MFHKNVPNGERLVRGVVALAVIVGGVWMAVTGSLLWGVVLAVGGAGFGVTAVSGWCPMCAMVGRTLPDVDKKVSIARL